MGKALQISGNKRGNLHEEAARVAGTQVTVEYDSDEWSSAIVTNESLRDTRPNLFKNVDVAHRVLIRADKTCTVKWNSTSHPAFTVRAGEPFEETRLEITDIIITTADTTAIKIYLN